MKQLMSAPTLKFRTKRQHPEETPETEEEPQTSPLAWTGGSAAAAKAISYLLIACLFAGPLALLGISWLVLTASGPAPAPLVAGDTAATVKERSAVEAFAEDFVVTWLTSPDGQEKSLAPFLEDYEAVTLPKVPWTVSAPAAAGIEQSEDGTWSVTVAATVASGKQPAARRHFSVPVTYGDGALAAVALPTPVAGPQLATTPRLGYRHRATTGDAVSVAAQQFLAALVVGSGDVTRFISPGAAIRAVVPAPYTAIALEDVLVDHELTEADAAPETGRTVHLLVTATATVTNDQAISVEYALTMTAREGRWEVAAIDATPQTLPTEAPTPSATQTPGGTTAPAEPSTNTN